MTAGFPDCTKAEIKGTKLATMDIELLIRHGNALMHRNLRWNITDQRFGEPLLGATMLEALGTNTVSILANAAAKCNGSVDETELVADPSRLQ